MQQTESATYLVTGGAGFIGSNFVRHLLAAHAPGIRVVVVDALTYAGHLETIADLLERPDVTLEQGDIADRDFVAEVMERHRPRYIVNFAAESHVDRSIDDPGIFVRTNVEGTRCLLDAARKLWGNNAEGCRFLQIGTDEVYGSLPIEWPHGRKVDGITAYGPDFFTEETPPAPRSPYSASKASADFLTLAWAHTYGLPAIVTRCSNNYGPAQYPEKLIPLMIRNLIEGKKIPVYGDGMNVRDWLYVDDHCRAIDLALHKGEPGQVYNIGGHNEHTNLEIVHTVIDRMRALLEADPTLLPAVDRRAISPEAISFVTDRPGHDRRYAIDPAKAMRCLGWAPATPFSRGIEKTVDWYLHHTDWMDSVLKNK